MEKILENLKKYFKSRDDISMAFLFGSYARGQETGESDVDIAIYFKPQGRELEWEEVDKDYTAEDEVWGDIEKIIGKNTDLLILNRAPASICYAAIEKGRDIIIKDNTLFWNYYLVISREAQDFFQTVREFKEIKDRSQSLNEIDRIQLIRIIDFLENELKEYDNFINLNQKDYTTISANRRNVERWIENIVNASIDVGKVILASEKKQIPQTYREILEKLSIIKNFNKKTAQELASFVKLRNVLAHEYLDMRFAKIKKFIDSSRGLYEELINFAKKIV